MYLNSDMESLDIRLNDHTLRYSSYVLRGIATLQQARFDGKKILVWIILSLERCRLNCSLLMVDAHWSYEMRFMGSFQIIECILCVCVWVDSKKTTTAVNRVSSHILSANLYIVDNDYDGIIKLFVCLMISQQLLYESDK